MPRKLTLECGHTITSWSCYGNKKGIGATLLWLCEYCNKKYHAVKAESYRI